MVFNVVQPSQNLCSGRQPHQNSREQRLCGFSVTSLNLNVALAILATNILLEATKLHTAKHGSDGGGEGVGELKFKTFT